MNNEQQPQEQINVTIDYNEVITQLTNEVAELKRSLAIEAATKSALVRIINEHRAKEKAEQEAKKAPVEVPAD